MYNVELANLANINTNNIRFWHLSLNNSDNFNITYLFPTTLSLILINSMCHVLLPKKYIGIFIVCKVPTNEIV